MKGAASLSGKKSGEEEKESGGGGGLMAAGDGTARLDEREMRVWEGE